MSTDLETERAQLQSVVDDVKAVMDRIFKKADVGYVLIGFSKQSPGFAQFAANVSRKDLIAVLAESLARLKAGDVLIDDDEPKL